MLLLALAVVLWVAVSPAAASHGDECTEDGIFSGWLEDADCHDKTDPLDDDHDLDHDGVDPPWEELGEFLGGLF